MASQISHTATVTAIGPQSVTVAIDGGSSCVGCRVSLLCGHNEDTIIQVVNVADPKCFTVGEAVSITATATSIWKAIIIGLMIPCVILLSLLLGCLLAGIGTVSAVLITFAAIAVYYIILAFNRQSLETSVRWTVEKLNSSQN